MDYQEVCLQTRKVVERAASFIRAELGKVEDSQIEDKDHNSLVSYVDKTAEQILVEGLGRIIPEATFLTEEETVENRTGTVTWIIDPLDGTTNFLYQIPVFSVSVGLKVGDELVIGVVHEVNNDECFYAWKGGGAFLDQQPIVVRPTYTMGESLIATGYPSRDFSLLEPYHLALKTLMSSSRGMRRLGSAAVDLAYVAAGRFSGYFEYGLSAWDVAGGIVILIEAGGQVSDFKGGENYLYGGEMIASNGHIHEELLQILGPAFHP